MVDSKHQWKAWLYLSPAIVLLLIFTVWPIINTVRIAFMEGYNALGVLTGQQFIQGMRGRTRVQQGTRTDAFVCICIPLRGGIPSALR